MNTTASYANIGPFKGVAKDDLSLVALHANTASATSLTALRHHADAFGDEVGGAWTVVPSSAAATAVWPTVEADRDSSRRLAKEDVWAMYFMISIPLLLSLAGPIFRSLTSITLSLFCLAVVAVTIPVCWFSQLKPAYAALREIRTKGWSGDRLETEVGKVASQAFLFGKSALHVSLPADAADAKRQVKSIYWDAIGHATTGMDASGLERLDVWGRDGTLLASMPDPVCVPRDRTAPELADLIVGLVAKARSAS